VCPLVNLVTGHPSTPRQLREFLVSIHAVDGPRMAYRSMAWEAMNEMLVPGWLERINPLMRFRRQTLDILVQRDAGAVVADVPPVAGLVHVTPGRALRSESFQQRRRCR
jgi:hypothetical protein